MTQKCSLKLLQASIPFLFKRIDPEKLLGRFITNEGFLVTEAGMFNPADFDRIFLIAGGKAAISMTEGIKPLFHYVSQGIVVYPENSVANDIPSCFEMIKSSHPFPTSASLEAGKKIMEIADKARQKDLLLCLISGGFSAMAELPVQGVSMDDISDTTTLLMNGGADIKLLNTVRKRMSLIKGGGLAETAYPASVISYILSDVPDDDPEVIASGPTVSVNTLSTGDIDKLKNAELFNRFSESVKKILQTERKMYRPNSRPINTIIGSNQNATEALSEYFISEGLTVFEKPMLTGEASVAGREFVDQFMSIKVDGPYCLIGGGETTVTVVGKGRGGRNQEFALASAIALAGTENIAGYSLGTDGTDGPTDSAGAFFCSETLRNARQNKLNAEEFLRNNDSNGFFSRCGGLVKTGPTGTNVMDVAVLIRNE